MEIITDAALITQIKAFIAKHDMKPTRFGREAMGDGALLAQLEEGRSLSLRNAEKVVRYMRDYSKPTTSPKAA